MMTLSGWFQGLGVVAGAATSLSANLAMAQIIPDTTLPENSRVITQNNIRIIEGGTKVGSNLFHSFEQFSVPTGSTAYFHNATDIQNIISRVTGKSISHIDGILQAKETANLFLLNPNGIIFGPNASLNIGGSFVASTASSLNFADGTKFSATDPQTTSLLTISVPIGLQFGATAAPIRNQSQASPNGATNISGDPVGLQVPTGKTLALVGGDVILDGGNLTVTSGRIELGSVAENSVVNLISTNQAWVLGYESVQDFQNIQLIPRTVDDLNTPSIVDVSGKDGNGNIQIQGKHILLTGHSRILTLTLGSQPGGDLTVTASDSVELGLNSSLSTGTFGSGKSGGLTITTEKLIVRDGAQVLIYNVGSGSGGQLTVNASDLVELIGGSPIISPFRQNNQFSSSGLFSATYGAGSAGGITINTSKLRVQGGARVSTLSDGILQISSNQFRPATGPGGNLTVNASESIELTGTAAIGSKASGLFAGTLGSAPAGNIILTTGQLIVREGATVSVSSQIRPDVNYLADKLNLGQAGELNVTARSIFLENKGNLSSETDTGQGGNIKVQVQDLLMMRQNSQISTNAGKVKAIGNGGNIFINAHNGFIVANKLENSDITANAFTGSGGKIQINATGLFGIVQRSREDLSSFLKTKDPTQLDPQRLPTSDITAISLSNPTLNGVVNLNTPDVDLNRELINLPEEIVEPKLASGCRASVAQNQSEFIITGRGGIPPNPKEALRSNVVHVPWVTLDVDTENYASGVESGNGQRQRSRNRISHKVASVNTSNQIVEAQGWIVDQNGEVVLVAQASTAPPHNSSINRPSCSTSYQ
jgi:filamentous hemagglutinin family protein